MGFLINRAENEWERARWEGPTLSKHLALVPAPRVATLAGLDTGCRRAEGKELHPAKSSTPVAACSGATGSSVRPGVT